MELGKQNDKLNGLILALCAVSAILICNTSLVDYYKTFLEVPIMFKVGSYKLDNYYFVGE